MLVRLCRMVLRMLCVIQMRLHSKCTHLRAACCMMLSIVSYACRSTPTMATTCSLACIAFVFMESLYSLAEDPGLSIIEHPLHTAPADGDSATPVCLAFAAVSRSCQFLSSYVLFVQHMPAQTLGILDFVTTILCFLGDKRVGVSKSCCGVYTQVLSFSEPAGAHCSQVFLTCVPHVTILLQH